MTCFSKFLAVGDDKTKLLSQGLTLAIDFRNYNRAADHGPKATVVSNEFEAFEKGIILVVFVRFGTLRRGAPDWHHLADLDLQKGTSRLEYMLLLCIPHIGAATSGAPNLPIHI